MDAKSNPLWGHWGTNPLQEHQGARLTETGSQRSLNVYCAAMVGFREQISLLF